jgi:hypothetical protein
LTVAYWSGRLYRKQQCRRSAIRQLCGTRAFTRSSGLRSKINYGIVMLSALTAFICLLWVAL